MKFYVIQSGSKGNATVLENDRRIILIDDGLSLTALRNALNVLGYNIMNIEALLLTHEHSDHTKGIQYLPPLPIYCREKTYEGMNVNNIYCFEPFELIGLKVTPLLTSHDAVNPCGFLFENGEEKFVYMTDTGYIPDESLKYMKNCDYYVIESNHDEKMQLATGRPACLINRIFSSEGHLSNKDSASYMASLVGPNTKQIVLAHLSEDANDPDVAIATYARIFKKKHVKSSYLEIMCASQKEMVKGGKE